MMENYTFILPAHNEEFSLKTTIKSLLGQKLRSEIHLSIVIVSNGCTDKTVDVVNTFIKSFLSEKSRGLHSQFDIKQIVVNRPQKGNALNKGRNCSSSDIVMYGDADCIFEEKSVGLIINELLNDSKLAVVGGLDIPHPKYLLQKSLLTDFQKIMQVERMVRGRVLTIGRLMGFKQSKIPEPFPDNIHSEDIWLSLLSAKKYGFSSVKVLLEAKVYYKPPTNWRDFLKQETRYEMSMPQLFNEFSELEKVYLNRRPSLTKFEIEERKLKVRNGVKKLKIPLIRIKQLHEIFDVIIEENAKFFLDQFIKSKGSWKSPESTKIWNKK